MEIILPKNISDIISIINNGGYNAHIVGGCVRDIIIGKKPEDWDITTNASTDIIKSLFEKTYDTGLKHGTVTVIYNKTKAEITTYRRESVYSDHRRPDFVQFTNSLTEDLSRRDFTVNSMAYHPKEGLTDPFNGLEDIRKKLIRCVGDPYKRFSEDALRMLRAVRFAAQLKFNIIKPTFQAIQKKCDELSYVSMERIQSEINKILISTHPYKLSLLWVTGLSKVVFPQIRELSVIWSKYALHFLQHENKKIILLSLLFITSFENDALKYSEIMLRRLKYDNRTIRRVSNLINCVLKIGILSQRNLRKALTEYGQETITSTLDIKAVQENIQSFNLAYTIRMLKNITPLKLRISGLDLNLQGLCNGPQIKEVLSVLELCTYEKPELNSEEILMYIAKRIVSSPIFKSTYSLHQ